MPALTEITSFLDEFFSAERFPDEQSGLLRATDRPVRQMGLTLQTWPGMRAWADAARLDALLLHRAWTLKPGDLADDVGILVYHLPFNERLTLGFNMELARVLGMSDLEKLGGKEGHRHGMIGNVPGQTVAGFYQRVRGVFGGNEEARTCETNSITRVAVAGVMTSALIHEASTRDADVYITDEYRPTARRAVLDTGIGVIAVGHRRSEQWGLRALAAVLSEHWPEMDVVLPPAPAI